MAELIASTLYCFFSTTMLFRLHQTVGTEAMHIQIATTAFAIGFLIMVLSHGFGITHNAYIFPAITFGKCLMRDTTFLRLLFYFIFQMIGGKNLKCQK